MQDVAQLYGKLFTGADAGWREVNKKPGVTELADADQEALRQVLYGHESPMNIPQGTVAEIEMYFDEAGRVAMAQAQAEVDRWNIRAAAAPAHAVILEDVPEPVNARILKRGNPATRGEEVPRRFLGVISGFGDHRANFEHGSGRLEMARAIVSRENPLTA